MADKILVIGGTGMLGQPVVNRLRIDGYEVRLMTHSPEKAEKIFGAFLDTAVGDVTDPDSLIEPIRGCDGVYINLSARMNPNDYERVEHQGAANVAGVAAEQNVRQIAMISGLNVGSAELKYNHVSAKAVAEKALIESGIPYTIFRCCWFFESLPLFVREKQAVVFGKQPHEFSWLAASDYAQMVSKAFSLDEAQNKVFHIRGIEKATIRETLTRFCQIVYPDAKISSVPLRLMSMFGKLSKKKEIRGIAQLMKYFDKTPETDANGESERILGPALTTLQDWAEDYKSRLKES